MLDKKKKIAIVCGIVFVCVVIVIAYCYKPKYDKNGNIIEITSVEAITDSTTEYTTGFTETTTDMIRPTTESTTSADDVIVPNVYSNTPGYIKNQFLPSAKIAVDKYITYDNKRLEVNFSMDSIKSVLGEPRVILDHIPEQTTIADREIEISGDGTEEVVTENSENNTPDNNTPALVNGAKNTHRYKDFIIHTEVENGVEKAKNIQVISKDVVCGIGKSPMDMETYEISEQYGDPSLVEGGTYRYNIDDKTYLYFEFSDNKVFSWGMASK